MSIIPSNFGFCSYLHWSHALVLPLCLPFWNKLISHEANLCSNVILILCLVKFDVDSLDNLFDLYCRKNFQI